jgi:predicted house-cleaning noncanonical NTP pyrophosphatase (MazG superfamily)
MRTHYGKLIRDRIPEHMDADGVAYEVRTLDEAAYRRALLTKLREEAHEASVAATPDERTRELADLLEVIDAVLALDGVERDEVLSVQRRRRAERGGFERRLELLWTERA